MPEVTNMEIVTEEHNIGPTVRGSESPFLGYKKREMGTAWKNQMIEISCLVVSSS